MGKQNKTKNHITPRTTASQLPRYTKSSLSSTSQPPGIKLIYSRRKSEKTKPSQLPIQRQFGVPSPTTASIFKREKTAFLLSRSFKQENTFLSGQWTCCCPQMERLNANICNCRSSQPWIPPFNVLISERVSWNDLTLEAPATLFPRDHWIWEQYGSTLRLSAPWGGARGWGIKAVPRTEAITDWWMPWCQRLGEQLITQSWTPSQP